MARKYNKNIFETRIINITMEKVTSYLKVEAEMTENI